MATKLNEEKALFSFGFVFQLLTSLALMSPYCLGLQPESTSLHSWALAWLLGLKAVPSYPMENLSMQTIGSLKIYWKASIPVPPAGQRVYVCGGWGECTFRLLKHPSESPLLQWAPPRKAKSQSRTRACSGFSSISENSGSCTPGPVGWKESALCVHGSFMTLRSSC